jgi:cytochrome c556
MKPIHILFTVFASLSPVIVGCGGEAGPEGGETTKEGDEKSAETGEKTGEGPAGKTPEKPAPGVDPGISEEKFEIQKKEAGKSFQALFKALESGELGGAEDLVKSIQKNTENTARFKPRMNAEWIEDYMAGASDLKAKLEELRNAAAAGDAERIAALARETGGICQGCHETFKPKEEEEGH